MEKKKKREKSSILDVLALMLIIVFLTYVSVASLINGLNIPFLLLGAVDIFLIRALLIDLWVGVRAPTRWEWFKAWMIIRPIAVVLIGVSIIMALVMTYRSAFTTDSDNNVLGMSVAAIALVWLGVVYYTIWRAPRRSESDEAYQKRIGWVEES